MSDLPDKGLKTAIPPAIVDWELVGRIGAGSVDAFEDLYDRYCAAAYRLAWSVCHDHVLASDAVEDAFVAVWRGRARYEPERGTVDGWLLTVVLYHAVAVVRRREARLDTTLGRLTQPQREVIALAYYGGLSHTQIAAQLGLSAATVKGRMRLGLAQLAADATRQAG